MKTLKQSCKLAVIAIILFANTNCNQGQSGLPSNNPKVHICVNKNTDEKGNVTEYDSTYTSVWSSNGAINSDSILMEIQKRFRNSFNDPFFSGTNNFFPPDSSLNFSFHVNDSSLFNISKQFSSMHREMMQHMRQIMQQQNEMMNKMYQHNGERQKQNLQKSNHEELEPYPVQIQTLPEI